MTRWRVRLKYVKWRGQVYQAGELLPETFQPHMAHHNAHSCRLEPVEIEPETPMVPRKEPLESQQAEQAENEVLPVFVEAPATPIQKPAAPVKKVVTTVVKKKKR